MSQVWKRRERKGIFYRKSLILFLITASLPGLIVGASVYGFAVGQMEEHLGKLHQRQIMQRTRNIDDQLQYLELGLAHWAFDHQFGPGLRQLDFVYYFQQTWDIGKTLVVLQGSHPLIKDAELYVERESDQPVLFRPGYYELNDEAAISSYKSRLADPRTVYWDVRNGQLMLVHKVPGDSTAPFGALLLTVKREKLLNLVRTLTPYHEGFTMLLDSEGHVLLSDSPETETNERLRDAVAAREDKTGTFVFEDDGVAYSVSYGTMQRVQTEWTFVSAAPLTEIVSPVVVTSRILINVSMLGLLAALGLSWFASNRIYSPVARLIKLFSPEKAGDEEALRLNEFQYLERRWTYITRESRQLQERLNRQLPYLRTGFLQQLLQGHLYGYSEEELRERLQRYGWHVEGHRFCMLHIQLTGYGSVSDRFSGDESLVSFTAANIMEELARERFGQFGVIPFYNLSIGLLVAMPDEPDNGGRLHALAEELTLAVNRILRMQLTVTIGKPAAMVKDVPALFAEMVRASGFRIFGDQNQLIDLVSGERQPGGEKAKYPFALEQEIVQSLRMGRYQEAGRAVRAFLEEMLSHRGTEYDVKQGMLQLLAGIRHMILEAGLESEAMTEGEDWFEQLLRMREPGKMVRWIETHVIASYARAAEARAKAQQKRMVERTIEYMHAHYMRDISLEACADLAGTTPYTLSKLFKQTTGVNFIDYLTDIRIGKAKALLRESDKKITDIAEEVGYQPGYFNRIFKKHVGVPPGKFREMA